MYIGGFYMFKSNRESTVGERGQTAIPARIRRRFGLRPGKKLDWVDNGKTISVVPVVKDPIAEYRGSSKGRKLSNLLLKERKVDARRV